MRFQIFGEFDSGHFENCFLAIYALSINCDYPDYDSGYVPEQNDTTQ